MTEEERMALVLGALDTAIQSLATTRDLLALAFVGAIERPVPPVEKADGACEHRNTVPVTTMGMESARLCLDCDEMVE